MKGRIKAAALRIAVVLSLSAGPTLGLASCSRGGWGILPSARVHEIRTLLPGPPSSWASLGGLGMTLSWRDPEGRPRSLRTEPGSRVGIEVERGFPQAILALPSSLSGFPLLPAGALYPEGLAKAESGEPDELVLDWPGGYAASVAVELEAGGVDPAGFDLYGLAGKAIERAKDPWLVRPLEVASLLAGGNFRIDIFREPARFSAALPGPKPWAPESPFASAPEAQEVLLPEGLWRFVGGGEELFASVDEKGRVSFVAHRHP